MAIESSKTKTSTWRRWVHDKVATRVTKVFVNGTKQASTSGTEIDFTIPSGVKKVVVTGVGVSTSGSDNIIFQIGDSGGIHTTGYGSAASYVGPSTVVTSNYSAGLYFRGSGAALFHTFTLTWVLHDEATNTWVGTLTGNWSTSAYTFFASGSQALDSELTTIRMTSAAGSVTFDAGSINIQYDNPQRDLDSGVSSGGVVQTVHTQDGSVGTGTTTIPFDGTIHQISEGDKYIEASITPKSVSNKLRIDVVIQCAHSATPPLGLFASLFQDSNADALITAWASLGYSNNSVTMPLTYWMDAGTTSSTTFSVRAGSSMAGTTTVNGNSGAERLGGTLPLSITITEYAA